MHTHHNLLKSHAFCFERWDEKLKDVGILCDCVNIYLHLLGTCLHIYTFWDFGFSLIRKRHVRWQNSMCSFTFSDHESMMTLSDATFPIMDFMFHHIGYAFVVEFVPNNGNILMIKTVHWSISSSGIGDFSVFEDY